MARTRAHTSGHSTKRPRGEHGREATPALTRPPRREGEHKADVETTDSFQLFLNEASRYPLLTAAEEIELAKRIEKGDLEAKERMVNSNLRLVISIARRYQGFGMPLADLVQEAMFGLIRAAEKFDWRRGYKFSTYATLWIRQAIQRGLDNSSRQIRLPANVAQDVRSLGRTEQQLTAKFDREPTEQELAENSKFSLEQVAMLKDLARVTTSLDMPVGEGDTTFGELHAGEAPATEDEAIANHRESAVASALVSLPERERRVIELRFGTRGEGEQSTREVGRKLGISQERVRQLEAQALERLSKRGSLDAWREAA
jgi:RNA polymerase primary sigma factor